MKLVCLILLAAANLLGDGGVIVLSGKTPHELITVFATPEPVRAGATDFSVLVQDLKGNPLLDGRVSLTFMQGAAREAVALSHAQSTNKLLYSATVELRQPGRWRLRVQYKTASEIAELTGAMQVGSPEPSWVAYWPYFAAIPVAVLLFLANQRLKRRRLLRRA